MAFVQPRKQLGIINRASRVYSPSFSNDLTYSMITSRGTGTLLFTRATTATVVDFEGLIKTVKSGEIRFTGARRVENLLTYTEDFSNAVWVSSNVTKSSNELLATAENGNVLHSYTSLGADYVFSVMLKRKTGTGDVQIAADSGTYTTVTLTTEWQRFSVQQTVAAGAKTAGINIVTDTDAIYIKEAQLELVEGQTNQNPSEYVSNGVLSSPYHGCNVDGVKCFSYENGNTVASNIVTETIGNAISSTTLKGYLSEVACTNLLLGSEDFLDASTYWSDVEVTTTANQEVAPDGNSFADKVLETVTNAQHYTIQTVAYASFTDNTSYTFSVYAKKVTGRDYIWLRTRAKDGTTIYNVWYNLATGALGTQGAGAVGIIEDAGNGWYRLGLTFNVLTGTTDVNFQIRATTGDNAQTTYAGDVTYGYYLWGAQVCNGKGLESYIKTVASTVTRNADVLTIPQAGNVDYTKGSIYLEVNSLKGLGISRIIWSINAVSALYFATADGLRLHDGTNLPTVILSDIQTGNKVACNWGDSTMAIFIEGESSLSSSFIGTFASGVNMGIGCTLNGTFQLVGHIKNFKLWKTKISDSVLNSLVGN